MTTVIILGMHRSGTSIIAGVLHTLGVYMGNKFIGAHWSNLLGHFENIEFVRLNDKILKNASGSWDDPPSKERILTLKDHFKEEINQTIKRNERELWGWKDPRTCLTIDLYMPYLNEPYFIICKRDPLAIARSLHERDLMPINKALELTNIYLNRIDEFFKINNYPKLELQYEHAINNPAKAVDSIINFLRLYPKEEQYNNAINMLLPRDKLESIKERMKEKDRLFKLKRLIKSIYSHLHYEI